MANPIAFLPQFQSNDKDFQLLQNSWGAVLNQLLRRPANNSILLKNVQLQVGANVVNHRLGRPLQGWVIIRKRADAAIYDTQDENQAPALTLNLVSDTAVSVDLMVF